MPDHVTAGAEMVLHCNRRSDMENKLLNRFISVITSLALVLSIYNCFSDSITNTYAVTLTTLEKNAAVSAEGSENPFDKQDDREVPYDRTRWVQPTEWNAPTFDPRDYEGGLMIYFDKIGLEPEYAPGKVQRVYCSITGATEPVSYVKFHIFYDTRLTVKENSKGEVITPGKGLSGFTTGSAKVEDGQLAFYAYGEDTLLSPSCLFTIDFIVPEDAEQGEMYPIGMAYTDDGIVADTFIKSKQDDAGRLQMTYAFTRGIYNGYIKIIGEKKTTTTTTVTTATTTTTADPAEMNGYKMGDVDHDGLINAVDASSVLAYYAAVSTNKDGGYSDEQRKAADADSNDSIDAVDASAILSYYAYASTTKEDAVSMEEFMQKN